MSSNGVIIHKYQKVNLYGCVIPDLIRDPEFED